MRIKNLAAKVIGVGNVRIMPGSDFVDIPDEYAYCRVYNERGEVTDKIDVLPSLRALERLNQIVIVETKNEKPEEAPEEEKPKKKSRGKKAE